MESETKIVKKLTLDWMPDSLRTSVSDIFLQDCKEGMKQYPDNYFDLAVVDPPYGISQTWWK